jgi:molybdopterin/thiamine biosynthesis adenylyltransferase
MIGYGVSNLSAHAIHDAPEFDYGAAFSRNIGWVSETEQLSLRTKRVAVAGLGGVGGSHVLTLTRLGIGAFNLADFDRFSVENFNRQAGAMVSTIGSPKLDVITAMAKDINPHLDIRGFPNGVSQENLDDFLAGVDLYVDGLDFFAFTARRATFAACARRGVPAVTSAPLGMGVAHLTFVPGGMTFEQYFRLEGQDELEQGLRFFVGLAPAMLQQGYLVDPTRLALQEHRGPSTAMGCQLCAGVAGTEALKILLGRGDIAAAPRGLQFDAYRRKLAHTWRPGGNNNLLQRFTLAVARRRLAQVIARQLART